MKVILAGFNVDTEALQEYKKKNVTLTPESIAAAYARISRSPKSVTNLRKEAREEIEKARKSNRAIIFDMGHHSIAEHAVFNFDVIGISRRAIEDVEKFRLCSYTEKSQRYVTLKGDFIIPKELKNTGLLETYVATIKVQNNFYKHLFHKIKKYNLDAFPKLASSKKFQKLLENMAKEDARYILPLATQSQLGVTMNARNLELVIRRFASHNLQEINELGKKFYQLVIKIAPSIILFCKSNDYDQRTYPELRAYVSTFMKQTDEPVITSSRDVELLDCTADADDKVLAALFFKTSQKKYLQCLQLIKRMPKHKKEELFKKSCQHMELYDTALREFEFASLTYSLVVSAACFGQLKRHRIVTITSQDYNPLYGFTIPDVVRRVGEEKRFIEIIKRTENVYKKIEKKYPGIGAYILTNAHHKRVLFKINLRELYHLSRLREDATAQWDIRNKVHKMTNLAKRVMPITSKLLGGKNEYPQIYFKLFGTKPKIEQTPQPG